MLSKKIGKLLIGLAISAPIFASAAQAETLVTYNWTTTSQGFGLHTGQPSLASFQVPLADVLAGVIPYIDITNIQLSYPGLPALTFTSQTSIGLDNQAFVDPVTGAFVYHDGVNNQGLGVVGYAGFLFSDTFLSITIDQAVGLSVKDQFNALNGGSAFAGFPTKGFWTASFPEVSATPLPAALPLFAGGLGLMGFLARRRARKNAAAVATA